MITKLPQPTGYPAVVDATKYAGANAGLKIQAAHDAFGAAGGTIDASGLSGAQSFSASLTISKPVCILFGVGTYAMGANGIVIAAQTPNVKLRGALQQAGGASLSDESGTCFTYTGTGNAITVGTTSLDTYYTVIEDIKLDCSGGGTACRGIVLNRTYRADLTRIKIRMGSNGTKQAIRIDGSGHQAIYNTITDPIIDNGAYGIILTGSSTLITNANRIVGGVVGGCTTGIQIEYGGTNYIIGTDLDTCTTGLHLGASARNNYCLTRYEGNTLDVSLDAGAYMNWIQTLGEAITSSGSGLSGGNYNTILPQDAFAIDKNGQIWPAGVRMPSGARITWESGSVFDDTSAGVVCLLNDDTGTVTRLQFGGTGASHPALHQTTAGLECVLANNSASTTFKSLYERWGSGSPEGVVAAPVGAIYHRTDGGTGTSNYFKETGTTTSSGWVAK